MNAKTYCWVLVSFLFFSCGCGDGGDCIDGDGDGYGEGTGCLDFDCDDENQAIHPGQNETPYDGEDNDCDPMTPDDDLDADGYGIDTDCDDGNGSVHPDAKEVAYDGLDNDCNPSTPDDDLDGDGHSNETDCDDGNPEVNPEQDEVYYNGIDDDCNPATVDDDQDNDGEAFPTDCDDVDPSVHHYAEEKCDEIDNDCDGDTDEDCECIDSQLEACGDDTGDCRKGTRRCEQGAWGPCEGSQGPVEELCDGRDNDCDEQTDEDFPDLRHSCTSGIGACAREGVMVCTEDQMDTQCSATPGQPCDEQCDGIDNDCDGVTDEGFPYVGEDCTVGIGECSNIGEYICDAYGNVVCSAQPLPAEDELCDVLDNDCDGLTDENFPLLGHPCSSGLGECREDGLYVCSLDSNGTVCDATPGSGSPESCDALDNDCDGLTDENLVVPCTTTCGDGEQTCFQGAWSACSAVEPEDEVCDGLDNDCDGFTDEDAVAEICDDGIDNDCDTLDDTLDPDCGIVCEPGTQTSCGLDEGECEPGVTTCGIEGIWSPCEPGVFPSEEQCDGLDNDCDGQTDEAWSHLGDPCVVWQGACSAYGQYVCSDDGSATTCSGQVIIQDEVCDGLDNDCDGEIDEDDPSLGTPCDECGPGEDPPCYTYEGECQPGSWFCVDAALACLGEIEPREEICDGLDNDCDGLTDENAEPEICDDGIDNDCDGFVDDLDPDC